MLDIPLDVRDFLDYLDSLARDSSSITVVASVTVFAIAIAIALVLYIRKHQ